jgi:hypothetical protein
MVYALGSTIVKRDIVDPKNQQFLQVFLFSIYIELATCAHKITSSSL